MDGDDDNDGRDVVGMMSQGRGKNVVQRRKAEAVGTYS